MRLAKWREEQELSQADLAEKLGCDQSFISRIERAVGPQIPSRGWMLKIHQLTRGEVTPNDFYDLPPIDQLQLPMEAPAPAPLFDQAEIEPQASLQAAA
jgi:transcriptional regulator with XRE-family HTH domain